MKRACIITENIAFADELCPLLKNYKCSISTIDMLDKNNVFFVLDLVSEKLVQDFEKMREVYIDKIYYFFKEISDGIKNNSWSSVLVLLPICEDYIFESVMYFIKGLLKSFACEIAELNGICNCIKLKQKDLQQAASMIAFFSDERAYMTAQILSPSFDFDVCEKFEGKKVSLVTGSGQGIGLAIIKEMKSYGYETCINDINLTENVKTAIQETDSLSCIGDISKEESNIKIISKIMEKHGRIDVFVANAAFMKMTEFEKLQKGEFDKHININLKGHLDILALVIEIMKTQKSGTIILISSMFGTGGWKNASAYSATKASMIGIGKYLAKELSPFGISVCTVAPGVINTSQLQADADDLGVSIEEIKRIYEKDIPLKRVGKAEDVAYLIGFLAEKGAKYLSGTIIQTNGGETRSTPETI